MKLLVTGADGFVGRNLLQHLSERSDTQVVTFTRDSDEAQLPALLSGTDFVVHLAGVNRPHDPGDFEVGNVGFTGKLVEALVCLLRTTERRPVVVYASSIQAELDNPYGRSKRRAEELLLAAQAQHQIPVRIFRLPNVFGKWAKPNYNSAVATFCHNISRGLPIEVRDSAALLNLVYIDDVVAAILNLIDGRMGEASYCTVSPQYTTTVGRTAELIRGFSESRRTLLTDRVGVGLVRALYSTYVSYLPTNEFAYPVPQYQDARGVFVEMLKTPDTGQFSFFTAHPGATRGGHYHHSKTEKFLVIRGRALFRFRHVRTGECHELAAVGETPVIVETVPGWSHDITNVGDDELIVMLWANEIFDRERPDTVAFRV